MPRPSTSRREALTEQESATLTAQLHRYGEEQVAKAAHVHRQTLNRAANRRLLHTPSRVALREYLAGLTA